MRRVIHSLVVPLKPLCAAACLSKIHFLRGFRNVYTYIHTHLSYPNKARNSTPTYLRYHSIPFRLSQNQDPELLPTIGHFFFNPFLFYLSPTNRQEEKKLRFRPP